MHERTRRLVCRVCFLSVCLLPTVVVVAWVGVHLQPWRARSYEQLLSERLGAKVRLTSVTNPRPGVMRFCGVAWADQEFDRAVLAIQQLDVVQGRAALRLVASGTTTISPAGLAAMHRLASERLKRADAMPIRLMSGEVNCRLNDRSITLVNLDAGIELVTNGAQATAVFHVAGVEGDPLRLRLVRNRQITPPTFAWELVTGQTPLPCWLVAEMLPALNRFGVETTFRGSAWAVKSDQGWTGQVKGQFAAVDLQSALEGIVPDNITGHTRIDVEHAEFLAGRLISLTARANGGPGKIGRGLLSTISERLEAAAPIDSGDLPDQVDYEQLDAVFRIDARGLAIHGNCLGAPRGTLLVGKTAPLLTEPRFVQPITKLFALLSPASQSMVPFTPHSQALAQILPLAEEQLTHAETARRPR